jgi:iron complex outermembrane receptor protein
VRGTESGVGWSLRAWGRVDRAELRGVSSFGDCQDGAPDCPRDDQRSSSLRGVGGLSVPMGETNAVDLSLAGGADWVHGATGAFRRNVFSAGARDDLAFSEGFSLHPGLRLDAVGGDVGLSPAVAVRWKPAANHPLAVRAGWGLSFRPPTFSELYLDRGGMVGNPELQPERAWSVDSGVEWRIGRLALSAGAFWSRYRDLILYQLFPPARVKPFNVGQARIAGFELQAVVPLPAHLLASLSYSFLDAVNRSDGHSLPYRPPHRLFARLSHRGDRFEGYGELSFTSRFPRNDFDSAFVDSQLLINTGAGVRAAGPLWVDVEIKNLLDNRTYEDLFQYPLPGLSVAVIARARL